MQRHALRRDTNESDIIDALERTGCTVIQMHVPCDLLVGIAGKNLLMEVKDGSRPPSGQKLTDTQVKLRNTWRGQFAVVKSVDEALAVVKAERWK